jgi:hypothetical protein
MNPNQFYVKTGLGIGFIDKVGTKLKRPSIEKISKAFPLWNIDYLQTGEGEMFKSEPVCDNNERGSDSIIIPREVFEQISRLTETVLSQQRTIESLTSINRFRE